MSSTTTTKTPIHITETMSEKRKNRELAEARQSGSAPPEIDVNSGAMINPHNPEFITRKPWYLAGNDEDKGPTLSHQADQRPLCEKNELSLTDADAIVARKRLQSKLKLSKNKKVHEQFKKNMWIESLRKKRKPYQMCKILTINHRKKLYEVEFEDGYKEKINFSSKQHNMRMTKAGARSFTIDKEIYGKETYDSKRDSYHGFEINNNFQKKMEDKFSKRDKIRRQNKDENKSKGDKTNDSDNDENNAENKGSGSDYSDDSDYDSDVGSDSDDEFVQKEDDEKVFTTRSARQGGVGGAEMKFTIRNLRIREDTAKYLRNLDVNSAYYDPKSRSMRDNPNPDMPVEELPFAGDNFARITGDAVDFARTQMFAWEAEEKGNSGNKDVSLHPQANPSQAELLRKKFMTKSEDVKMQQKKALLAKYGGEQYLDGTHGLASAIDNNDNNDNSSSAHGTTTTNNNSNSRKTRFEVQSTPQFYSRAGSSTTTSSSKPQVSLKSKYQEDIFTNGHTTVWGSFFHKGAFRWGYADDHSLLQKSYCTGIVGREANDTANDLQYGNIQQVALQQARAMLQANKKTTTSQKNTKPTSINNLYGEVDSKSMQLDPTRLKEAILKTKEKKNDNNEEVLDERKRKYNSVSSYNEDVTEEDMEVYRMHKSRGDDPMAKFN